MLNPKVTFRRNEGWMRKKGVQRNRAISARKDEQSPLCCLEITHKSVALSEQITNAGEDHALRAR
jgi:hypothetical protein